MGIRTLLNGDTFISLIGLFYYEYIEWSEFTVVEGFLLYNGGKLIFELLSCLLFWMSEIVPLWLPNSDNGIGIILSFLDAFRLHSSF